MTRFFEKWTEYDSEAVHSFVWTAFGPWPHLTGSFSNWRSRTGQLLTLASILTSILLRAFYTVLFVITAFRLHSELRMYSHVYLMFGFAMGVLTFERIYSLIQHRNFGEILNVLVNGFYHYHFEEEVSNEKLQPIYYKRVTNAALIMPYVNLFTVISFGFIRTSSNKIVNEVDLSLFPFPMWFPFHVESDGVLFFFLEFTQCLSTLLLSIDMGVFICMYVVGSIQLIIQLDRLIESLRATELRAIRRLDSKYTPSEDLQDLYRRPDFSAAYIQCLKENVDHYNILVRYYNDFKNVAGAPLGILLIFASGTMAFGMATVAYSDLWIKVIGALLFIIMFFITFVVCLLAEIITDKKSNTMENGHSESVRESIYELKWYYCEESVKSCIRIIMTAQYEPLRHKPLGFLLYNMEVFYAAIKGAYSFFNVLNAI